MNIGNIHTSLQNFNFGTVCNLDVWLVKLSFAQKEKIHYCVLQRFSIGDKHLQRISSSWNDETCVPLCFVTNRSRLLLLDVDHHIVVLVRCRRLTCRRRSLRRIHRTWCIHSLFQTCLTHEFTNTDLQLIHARIHFIHPREDLVSHVGEFGILRIK